jgi:hypothetical protein
MTVPSSACHFGMLYNGNEIFLNCGYSRRSRRARTRRYWRRLFQCYYCMDRDHDMDLTGIMGRKWTVSAVALRTGHAREDARTKSIVE